MDKGARQRLRNSNAQARELLAQIRTAAHGERALAVLLDQINLDATRGAAPPGDALAASPITQVLDLAAKDIAANELEIGLDPAAPDMEAQLRARVEAERAMLEGKKPIDFTALVRQWSAELQRDPHQRTGVPQRLATAAQAEAVRGDREADMVRARDLDLCGRAVGAIESALNQAPRGKPAPQAAGLGATAAAMTSLQREQALARQLPYRPAPAEEVRAIHAAAYRAREELARWAGETAPAKNPAATLRPGELESMALRVNSDSTRHEYKRVAEEDRQLAQKLADAAGKPGRAIEGDTSPVATQVVDEHLQRIQQASEAVTRQMSAADAIEKMAFAQEKLTQELRSVKVVRASGHLRQRTIADQIAAIARRQQPLAALAPAQDLMQHPVDPSATTRPADAPDAGKPAPPPADWNRRAQAMMALLAAQEELTLMKQQAALALERDAVHRRAAEHAAAAWHEVATAPAQRLRQAHRAADRADVDVRDAVDEFENAIAPLRAQAAATSADDLEPFALEAPPRTT